MENKLDQAGRTGSSAPVTLYLGSADTLLRRELVPGAAGFALASASTADPQEALTPADLTNRLLAWLAADALPQAKVHPIDLSIAELTAVAAVVDAYREERLRALIERRDPQPDRFSIDDLLFQVHMGCLSRNTRWFGGILAAHAPIECEPLPEDLREGLIGLTLREWLREADHRWEPQGTLVELCERLGNLNPYAVIASDPHGASPIAPLTLMRIASGVCALQYRYESGREPWARVTLADTDAGRALLHEHLNLLLVTMPPAPAAGGGSAQAPWDLPESGPLAPLAPRPADLPEPASESAQRAARPTDLPN